MEVKLHSFLTLALYGVVNLTLPPLHAQERTPAPIDWEPGWTSWRREKSVAQAGIRITSLPTRSLVTTPTTLPRKNSALVHLHLNIF